MVFVPWQENICTVENKDLDIETHSAHYLSIPALCPSVHLTVVFGVVLKKGGLAVVHSDHAAVVRIVLTMVTEEFPTKLVSRGDKNSFLVLGF